MAKAKQDVFAQVMQMEVTMSAANTLTFAAVLIGTPLFDYAALILERIDYYVAPATMAELITNADILDVAITGKNSLTNLDLGQAEVYDRLRLFGVLSGTAATLLIPEFPLVHDFSTMSGGGLLVPAQTVYIGMTSSNLTPAGIANARVYYRIMDMNAPDYLEMVQRLNVLST